MTRPVLLVSTEFPPVVGGAGRYAVELARALHSAGVDVEVVVPPSSAAEAEGLPYPVVAIGPETPRRRRDWLPAFLTFRRAVRARPEHVVVAVDWVSHILASWTSRTDRRPYVICSLGSEVVAFATNPTLRALSFGVYRRTSAIVAISEFTRSLHVARGRSIDEVSVVPPAVGPAPAVDRAAARAVLGVRDEEFVLLQVARLVARKGHVLVLDALADLRRRGAPVPTYFVVGGGPLADDLARHVARLDLVDHVRFLGAVGDDVRDAAFAASDVFVMPGVIDGAGVEGFGIAYVEAARHGRPAIGTRHGAVPEVVIDGETGLLVSESDAVGLAHAIAALQRDPARTARMGEAARARAADAYDHAVVAARFLEVLDRFERGRQHA